MKPPQTKRQPLPVTRDEQRRLLRQRLPADRSDPFASDPDPDIQEMGKLALRLPADVNYSFALGDLCATRSIVNEERLLIFYVGKALIAYRRAGQRGNHEVDQTQAIRAADEYARWVIRTAIARPTQRNIAVALWVAARESDESLPIIPITPLVIQELLSLYQRLNNDDDATQFDATREDATAFSDASQVISVDSGTRADNFVVPDDTGEMSSGLVDSDESPATGVLMRYEPPTEGALNDSSSESGESSAILDMPRLPSPPTATTTAPELDFNIGDRIDDRYEVSDIRLGGMGVVYLCYDHELRAPVAIKSFQRRFMDNERAVARFEQEAFTWVRLEKHLHIVRALLVQKIQARPHIMLEYVSAMEGLGVDLRSWIEHNRLTLANTLLFAIHIALGMRHATLKIPGLVHRDLKPGNILVSHDGIAKVTDFGLVRSLELSAEAISGSEEGDEGDARLTRAHAFVGTPPYMSPEQFTARDVDLRADIYSFGCLLYEMLTGKPPFRGRNMAEWRQAHTTESADFTLPALVQAPPALLELLRACLMKDPLERPQNWNDLVQTLSAVYEDCVGPLPDLAADGEALEAREIMDKGYSLTELGKYSEALEAYDQAIALNRTNSWYWARRARTLRLLERYDEALATYQQAIALQPDYAWAWNGMGIIYDRQNRLTDALEAFQKSVSLGPHDMWSWYNLGDMQLRLEDTDQAIISLREALRLDPRGAQAWAKLGKVYRTTQDLTQSVLCYRQAVSLQPNYAWAYNGLGLALKAQGQLDEAVAAFKHAAQYEPHIVWHWYNLAETLVLMQRYLDALHPAQEATRIAPQNATPWGKLGQILRYLRRHEEALTAYNRAIELDPAFDWAINGRGLVLENMSRYDEALESYEQATALNPERDWHWYNQANTLYQLRRYDESLLMVQRALEHNTQFTKAWALLGSVQRQRGQHDAALAALRTALDQDDEQAWTWGELGTTYEAMALYRDAEEAYRRAFLLDGQNITYLYKQAEMLVQTDHNTAAMALLQQALNFNDRSANIWAKLGQVLRKLERYDDALEHYNRALALDPEYTWAWNGKGLTLSALGRHPEALNCFLDAVQIDPQDIWSWYSYGDELLILNRTEEAITALRAALQIDAQHVESWGKLGQALRLMGKHDEAVAAYQRAVELRPHNGWGWNGLGLALKEAGRTEEALVSYQRAIDADPRVTWYAINLMTLQLDTGRRADALNTIERAVELDPENPNVWARRGHVLRRLNRYTEALQSYDTALSLDGGYAWAWNGKGLCLMELRRPDEALACYQRAVHYDSRSVWFWYNYGDGLAKTGDLTEAKTALQQALKIDPQHILARERLAAVLRDLGES